MPAAFIPADHDVLAHYISDHGDIWISEDIRTESRVYWQGRFCQSESDADGVSYAPYVHALFGFLLQTPAGTRPDEPVLVIGCGGGSLATMLDRAERAVELVDVNPLAFPIARQHFGLPPWIPCHLTDGAAFLRGLPATRRFGAIVVDAFHGDVVPGHLLEARFLADAAWRLAENGFLAMNLFEPPERPDLAARTLAIAGRAVAPGGDARLFEETEGREGNILLLAGAVAGLTDPDFLLPPRTMIAETRRSLERMRFRLIDGVG
ncbi:spermidine synthase [Gluconacetobacter sacchari]|uniref:Fused MFS/spermidine synthase n=2 Tax=Gluconacetobacter sacchari TaxID=92759 RepID=A0A7W4NQ59_9PROT|nr:fused MFS/spermidine synthase [Gluconacetobacter sacchari]MBB2158790.1 fused MFS/spermidine synthase [Gluconacetobacter sacchari]GBQ23960.1 spermidine synthase family protein [Gluconacetobacter sacchari DSM 12717]